MLSSVVINSLAGMAEMLKQTAVSALSTQHVRLSDVRLHWYDSLEIAAR